MSYAESVTEEFIMKKYKKPILNISDYLSNIDIAAINDSVSGGSGWGEPDDYMDD